jgi:hypothetical protein
MPSNSELATVTRRDLLRMAVAGSVTLGLGGAASVGAPRRARAQTALTAAEALKALAH